MPARAWEDLSVFLDPDEFADLANFTCANGQVILGVPGIFDDAIMNVESGEYDMAAAMPRFTCEFARVSMLRKNDEAMIGRTVYLLDHNPHSDGTGMAVLELSRDVVIPQP